MAFAVFAAVAAAGPNLAAPPGEVAPQGVSAPAAAGGSNYGLGGRAKVLERAKPVFEAQCGFCHGSDARGRAGGPDLARSLVVLGDTNGKELSQFIRSGRVERGMPGFPGLTEQELLDIAYFLHQVVAASKTTSTTDVMLSLVGDAQAGKAYFTGAGRCTVCHSVEGDLAAIGARYDPATLQDRIVNPRGGASRKKVEQGVPRSARTVAVTLADGTTFSGRLDFVSEFAVTLIDDAGSRRSFTRDGDMPKVVVTDPLQVHFDMLRTFRDKDMQNLTAYLWTIK